MNIIIWIFENISSKSFPWNWTNAVTVELRILRIRIYRISYMTLFWFGWSKFLWNTFSYIVFRVYRMKISVLSDPINPRFTVYCSWKLRRKYWRKYLTRAASRVFLQFQYLSQSAAVLPRKRIHRNFIRVRVFLEIPRNLWSIFAIVVGHITRLYEEKIVLQIWGIPSTVVVWGNSIFFNCVEALKTVMYYPWEVSNRTIWSSLFPFPAGA